MESITLPTEYNYIGIFLTYKCNLQCSYCINMDTTEKTKLYSCDHMTGDEWIRALNRIPAREDLPLSLQGGEPTVHPAFYAIAQNVKKPMDLLTNLQFDVKEFCKRVPKNRFRRKAPYAAIRVSYHPEQMHLQETLDNICYMLNKGYQVGLYMIEDPRYTWALKTIRKECERLNIDFRTKDLLGWEGTHRVGQYKYPSAVSLNPPYKNVECRGTELLIAPNGIVHRCHSDLYNIRKGIGHILDKDLDIEYIYRDCNKYGTCNPCDIKITNNRFQQFGHTSVEIQRKKKF